MPSKYCLPSGTWLHDPTLGTPSCCRLSVNFLRLLQQQREPRLFGGSLIPKVVLFSGITTKYVHLFVIFLRFRNCTMDSSCYNILNNRRLGYRMRRTVEMFRLRASPSAQHDRHRTIVHCELFCHSERSRRRSRGISTVVRA